jgi:hypothetical protein
MPPFTRREAPLLLPILGHNAKAAPSSNSSGPCSGIRLDARHQTPAYIAEQPTDTIDSFTGTIDSFTEIDSDLWHRGIAHHFAPVGVAIYHYLCMQGDENSQCRSSPRIMARMIGCSQGAVKCGIKRLEKCNILQITPCSEKGGNEGATDIYTLLPLSSFRDPTLPQGTPGEPAPD